MPRSHPKFPGLSETARVEAFSDGVFAIAITLLVLEIRVPDAHAIATTGGLLPALGALWPSYLGYMISFVTIGIMWANHHAIFTYIDRADRYFLIVNVAFLMCIAFIPFPTAVLAEYLPNPAQRRVAVAAYSATLIIVAIAYNALWWYAVYGKRLLASDADLIAVATISKRYALGPIAYSVSFALAFVNVWASLAVHGILAGFYLLPERSREAVRGDAS